MDENKLKAGIQKVFYMIADIFVMIIFIIIYSIISLIEYVNRPVKKEKKVENKKKKKKEEELDLSFTIN